MVGHHPVEEFVKYQLLFFKALLSWKGHAVVRQKAVSQHFPKSAAKQPRSPLPSWCERGMHWLLWCGELPDAATTHTARCFHTHTHYGFRKHLNISTIIENNVWWHLAHFSPRPVRWLMPLPWVFLEWSRTARRITLKFCTAYGASFAELLVNNWPDRVSGQVLEAMTSYVEQPPTDFSTKLCFQRLNLFPVAWMGTLYMI